MEDVLMLMAVIVVASCGVFWFKKVDIFLEESLEQDRQTIVVLENALLISPLSFLVSSGIQFEIDDNKEKIIQQMKNHQIAYAILLKPVRCSSLVVDKLLLPIEDFNLFNEIYVVHDAKKMDESLQLLFKRCRDCCI